MVHKLGDAGSGRAAAEVQAVNFNGLELAGAENLPLPPYCAP